MYLKHCSRTIQPKYSDVCTTSYDPFNKNWYRSHSGGLLVPVIPIPSIEAAYKTGQVAINRSTDAMKYGFPFLSNIKKTTAWVRKQLSAEIITGAAYRKFCDFKEDDLVHLYHISTNADYKGSGFDRGHLATANHHLNQNAWNNLEKYCRSLIKHYQNVFVCTGPLYLPR
uniref:ENPP1-3/EXOG-like endonuclease/phosphodiesterase domain-containing protein n=1 Tax=Cyprinus carpio TaxID=7962 RepID=A0A8C1XUG6_CYPCA